MVVFMCRSWLESIDFCAKIAEIPTGLASTSSRVSLCISKYTMHGAEVNDCLS